MRSAKRSMLPALAWGLACSALCATASAQEWADKMFTVREHDFGSVARAAKVEYAFELVNPYKEDIHISSVRSSCGCTSPRIQKDTLKSWEKGAIIAEFNTRAFSGQRGARVTVTIDKPLYAEVQLQVRGYIRTDVVVDPGQVAFGQVPAGDGAEKTVTIDYSGRSDWKILGVEPTSPYVKADLKEVTRQGGRVAYKLAVVLDKAAPTGYVSDELVLKTNDTRSPQFPVKVEGFVVPDLTVSPTSLLLGILQPGQRITKQVVLKGKTPFHVLSIDCDNPGFSFPKPSEAKTVHLIPITFEAGTDPVKFIEKITIRTDLTGNNQVELSAYGQVLAPLAGK
ncbi:MAG TPA: DUF1573 domain-containing protein [Pirellulales bacterium]|nr:DUF1573 domain-containing protein [Pirellulales bacterium]